MTQYATSSLYNLFNRNPRKMKGGSVNNMSSVFQLMSDKKQFLLLTFANLIVQLGITYYFMEKYTIKYTGWERFGLFILVLVIMSIMIMVPMPAWGKFILFSVLSTIFGLYLSVIKVVVAPNIINVAIVGTIAIYVTMLLIGLFMVFTGIQLSYKYGLILYYSLFALILFEVITLVMGTAALWHRVFAAIGLVLFSFYIIYDTNNILRRDYYGDFITASLDYYLDILNIFTNFVDLLD